MDTFPHDLLRYEPETGRMFWRKNRYSALIGKEAGSTNYSRRWKITLTHGPYKSKVYLRSRLAFLWKYGRWPYPTVDHINRDCSDDRIENLREATRSQQQHNRGLLRNNKSGQNGVRWIPSHRRWQARIRIPNGKSLYLGEFRAKQAAIKARKLAEITLFPPPNSDIIASLLPKTVLARIVGEAPYNLPAPMLRL